MRKRIAVLMLWALALATPHLGATLWAQDKKEAPPAPPEPAFKVGDMAPDFTMLDQNRQKITLSSFRGKKNVAVAFVVFAFTGG